MCGVCVMCVLVCVFLLCLVLGNGKFQRRPESNGHLTFLTHWLLGHGGVDTQLSVIHQVTGEAGQVEVSRQVDLLGESHLRRGRGAKGGMGRG